MRVLIVDDEPNARRRLGIMLEELDIEVVGEAGNGVEALELVRQRSPDVLLLDIAMPEVDGFDVARHLPVPRPLVIFQTAYHEYALKAFEHEALDYVVKPVSLERLRQALERARRRLEVDRPAPWSAELIARLTSAIGDSARTARVLVNDGTGHRLLAFREIIRFSADEGRVFAHTGSARFSCDYTLNELEQRTGGAFVRVSRAELINVERIQHIESAGDGLAMLTLADGNRVQVSRRRVSDVRRVLEGA
ncbi:MAG: LytR/AlgR family response regulator transcription factor [Longimicrobiales bacterium]